MAQSLETLVVDLRARTKILERDLDKANRKIASKMKRQGRTMANDLSAGFTRAFGKLAAITGVAVSFGALQSAIRSTVQESSMLQTTADKLGLTTTALQELRYAGEQFNITTQTTDMALQRFSRRVAEAAQGTGELKGTLEQYGIATRDSNGRMRNTLDVLRDFADVVKDAESEQERLRIAFKAFDSEGVNFVNILRDGSAGLSQLRAEAHAFGQVIAAENIRRLAEIDQKLKRFKGGWQAIFTELIAGTVSLSDSLGITGLQGELKRLDNQLRASERAAAKFADLQNLSPMDAMLSGNNILDPGELARKRMERQVILSKIVEETATAMDDLGRVLGEQRQLQEQFSADDPAYHALGERIAVLAGQYKDLGLSQAELISNHPETAAMFMELSGILDESATAISLTAEETARLKSIMGSTVTPAERLEEQLALINRAIEAFPARAEEYQEAARRLKEAYEESLKPDKMDKLLETWERMADGMSTSLSEALVEGEDALTRSLQRMLRDIQAAALEAAIIAPILGAFGISQNAGGGFNWGDFFKFGTGKRAMGGPVSAGSPYIVGERGRELFVPNQSGTIIPNNIMGSISGTGGGDTFNIPINLHFDVGLESVDNRIAQAAPILSQSVQAAISDRQRRRPF